MNIQQNMQNAVRNLLVNKIRFVQAMLAMVIGVAAIVAVCNICRVLLNFMEEVWNPASFSVMHMYIDTKLDCNRPITIEDMDRIAAKYPEVIVAVSPFVYDGTMSNNVWYDNEYCKNVSFVGVNENYLNAMPDEKLTAGRFIQYMDCSRQQNVCVVSNNIVNKWMSGDALGKTLKIFGIDFMVIGVIEKDNADTNDNVYLPYTTATRIVGEKINWQAEGYINDYYSNRFVLLANGVEKIDNARRAVEQEVATLLGEEANKDRWFLTCASQLFFYEAGKGGIYSLGFNLMLAVALILVVGGVGIMNVMLANVRERIKEIGIRKAFGANNQDIQHQFMLEAVIISLLGGIAGVILGELASFAIPMLFSNISLDSTGVTYPMSDLDINITVLPILLALAVSVGVGVIFGTYPAQQAAKMEIVDAINSD